jgi:hypothetical protein
MQNRPSAHQIKEDVDNSLCAFFDITDADDAISQGIIEYCHENKVKIAVWIKERYFR